jgi:toluene monooxygenase electron transfer component
MVKIKISDSDMQYECADGDTILRAGLRAGMGMPYECSVGSCGTCKIELLEGTVDTLWTQAPGLSERDVKRGRSLACQSRPKSDCTIKVRLGKENASHHQPRQFDGTLVDVRNLTHDLREFRIRADRPAEFLPGQYGLFALPGVSGMRAYSMSNISNPEGEWHFQIKRVPKGAGTTVLFDQTNVGDTIKLDGPFGLAYLRNQSPRDIVCIAGGSGLSPMVSIARGIAREKNLADRKIHFFYGGRGPQDICGEEFLRELPGYGERISFYPVISMPELDVDRVWKGKTGFVHDVAAEMLSDSLPQFECYFAGPPPMALAVQKMLLERKVPYDQIHFDRFF